MTIHDDDVAPGTPATIIEWAFVPLVGKPLKKMPATVTFVEREESGRLTHLTIRNETGDGDDYYSFVNARVLVRVVESLPLNPKIEERFEWLRLPQPARPVFSFTLGERESQALDVHGAFMQRGIEAAVVSLLPMVVDVLTRKKK